MTRVLVADDPLELGTVVANALATRAELVQSDDLVPATEGGAEPDGTTALCETVARCCPSPDVVIVAWPTIDRPRLEALTRLLGSDPVATLVIAAAVDPEVGPRLEAVTCDAVDVLLTGSEAPSASAEFAETLRDRIAVLEGLDVSSLAVAQTAATASSIRAAHAVCAGSRAATDSGAGGARADATAEGARTATATGNSGRTATATSTTAPAGASVRDSVGGRTRAPLERGRSRRGLRAGTEPDAHASTTTEPRDDDRLRNSRTPSVPSTVVVGASTGGPAVVEGLLAGLPAALEARVFVVQHMPAVFTGRFADRLDAASDYAVVEPDDGDRVEPGMAVVAPGDTHLRVQADDDGLRVALEDAPAGGTRPSIDVTMESAARAVEGPLCGVVCTGMGRDGAAGIEAIADAGGHTIAQDEATSSVFGIPAQAIRTGCVDDVVPADLLPERVVEVLGGDHRGDG